MPDPDRPKTARVHHVLCDADGDHSGPCRCRCGRPGAEPAPDCAWHVETACKVMHNAYEAAAAGAGWETQEASRKPWADVPEANKATMRAAVKALWQAFPVDRVAILAEMARWSHNGAADPWQEFYDLGYAPMLDRMATTLALRAMPRTGPPHGAAAAPHPLRAYWETGPGSVKPPTGAFDVEAEQS